MDWVVKTTGQTIGDYRLIEDRDVIAVAISGGKDSWSLLHLLQHFQRVSKYDFEIKPVTVNPGFEGFPLDCIEQTYRRFGISYTILDAHIRESIEKHLDPGTRACAFCARLRRGALYRFAKKNNCSKIALGHHADDAMETLFLSGFFEGKLSSMPPRLNVSDNSLCVIRPLIRIFENDLSDYCRLLGIEAVSCRHGRAYSAGRRGEIKEWLRFMDARYPGTKKNLLAALQNLRTHHFLDPDLL